MALAPRYCFENVLLIESIRRIVPWDAGTLLGSKPDLVSSDLAPPTRMTSVGRTAAVCDGWNVMPQDGNPNPQDGAGNEPNRQRGSPILRAAGT